MSLHPRPRSEDKVPTVFDTHREFAEDLMGEVIDFMQRCEHEQILQSYQTNYLLEMAIELASQLDNAFEVRGFVDKKGQKK